MNVLKIVVDEVPECCDLCWFVGYSEGGYSKHNGHFCEGTNAVKENKIISVDPYKSRPDWCPLVVEEVCEWKEHMKYNTSCDVEFDCEIHYMNLEDDSKIHFCPNCGKPIKYVEEE